MAFSRTPLRNNLRRCTLDGVMATPICFLLQPGNFIVAAMLSGLYRLPPAVYGLVVSLPFWCNFLQAGLTPMLLRFVSPKALAVWSAGVQAVVVGVLALALFLFPPDRPDLSGPWFVVFFGVLGLTIAFSGVGWVSWVQEWVPPRLMGRYFGMRNRITQTITVLFLLTAGFVLDELHRSVLAFQLLLAGTVILRVGSVWMQQRTVTPAGALNEAHLPWREQLEELRRRPSYFWFIAYGAAWGFAANFFGAFYPVFMYEQLGLSVKFVSTMLILTGIGSAISYPGWGKLADRFGNKPVMIVCMVAWQAQYAVWVFLTPQNIWLLYALWSFAGATSAGFILGLFNIQLRLIPPTSKTLAISINLAVTSLLTAVAPILGGWTLQHLLATGAEPLSVYHRLFVAQPVIAVLACALLWRVHEPNSSPLSTVVGAMRNVRTLGGILGLTYIVSFVFVKAPKSWSRSSTR